MKLNNFLFLSLIIGFSAFNLNSQTILKDNDNFEIIPGAHIINSKAQIIGVSNMDGTIFIYPDYRGTSDSVTIEHIAYEAKSTTLQDINSNEKFYLKVDIKELPGVTISPTKTYDYLVIKGYYRSYQLNDKVPIYYSDGIIEYYIPTKNKDGIKYKLLHNRSYKNEKLLSLEKQRVVTVSVKSTGVSNYGYYWVPYNKSLYKILSNDNKKYFITDKKENYAGEIFIDKSKQSSELYINGLTPDSIRTVSLFGYTVITSQELYSQKMNTSDIENTNLSNLSSLKLIHKIDFKHKKDKRFTNIDGFDEFHVIEVYNVNKKDLKRRELLNNYTQQLSTNKEDFSWLEEFSEYIPQLNKSIENMLHNELEIF